MKKILLTNNYTSGPYEIVQSVVPEGFELIMLGTNVMENVINDVDYILASGRTKITREVLEKAQKLKMIQRTGVGLDSLDLCAIKDQKIPLYVNQGINAESVAEHTLLLMLACLRRLTVIHQNTKNGIWKKQEQGVHTFELRHKKIGLVGMGNISRTLVGLLKPFEVELYYFDPYRLPTSEEERLGIYFCTFEELIRKVDILSLHCPLTNETKNMVNENVFQEMKEGSILVNTARGGLVDIKSLEKALISEKISFAGLDVFPEEPLVAGEGITELDNVILTPHIGGVTRDSFQDMMRSAMRNIAAFEEGRLSEIEDFRYKV